MSTLNLHLQADNPKQLLAMLQDLMESTSALVHGTHPGMPQTGGQEPPLALYTTEELMAEIALRMDADAQDSAKEADLFAPDPAGERLAKVAEAAKPAEAPKRPRGRPRKDAAPTPEPTPVQGNGHDVTGEVAPDPAAFPAEPGEVDASPNSVAANVPDRTEMERIISALFSRGKSMDQVRELITSVTGAPTLGKAPKESWPRLYEVAQQELKNMAAKVQ